MEKGKQPIVYVAREIWMYDEMGEKVKVANFVSRAYLRKSIVEYKQDGSADKEFFVDFNVNPAIFAMDRNTSFHVQNGDNEKVDQIFKSYEQCKQYVNVLNKNIVLDVYNFPVELYLTRNAVHEKAVEYGNSLEREFIKAANKYQIDAKLDK